MGEREKGEGVTGWRALCQTASVEEVNRRSGPTISVPVAVSKELQPTASSLSAKRSLLKHSYTLRGRAGCFCEVKSALLYRLKGVYKELSARSWGVIMGE